MKAAVVRLDSFAPGQPDAAASAVAAALDEAHGRGHALGLQQGRDGGLDALAQALAGIRADLAEAEARMREHRREILAEVAPVLAQIIDMLAPRSATERLCDGMAHVMSRLAAMTPGHALKIRCLPEAGPAIAACLARAGLEAVLEPDLPPGQAMAELACDRARIRFDPSTIVDDLKSIVATIAAED